MADWTITPKQLRQLRRIAEVERMPCSNANGPHFTATGTADALQERGLCTMTLDSRLGWVVAITDAGRDYVARTQGAR